MASVNINFSAITTNDELQELLMNKLNFPEFYGMNWNAFWDSITGLVIMPEKIELVNWQYLLEVLPDDARLLLNCLNEYNEQPDLRKIELLIKEHE